ncbi:MAG TPA: bifunctional glutamate N-acetyltransferase/amino-acid acetyltransferase ArgJ [Tepidisphaeraceae bacterium]|jgi:glutamate N-acetyltransferase/amino-acid N-acetyltransferase|nr:bifunctional glutamate N-acetyltransferase/amino-acid acetyltransferase ArgJ [Tepidisphaeraceae bacterium]
MPNLHLLSPKGFRASGLYAGIKSKPNHDIGFLVADRPASAAAVFTTNRVFAAPIAIGRKHVAAGKLRGVVLNSGNANACTGPQGLKDAVTMCKLASSLIPGTDPHEFLPSSTGIIGHLLPMEKITAGIRAVVPKLGSSEQHALDFGASILTTDTKRKAASAQFKIGKETITLSGICKGAGMIGPRMALPTKAHGQRSVDRFKGLHATMLAYLTTDAMLPPSLLRELLSTTTDSSFNAVTIDDHMSTNDTACLLASGASGAKIDSPKSIKTFTSALDEVCQSLAYQIAADGEGATKVVRIEIKNAKDDQSARAIARSIANSPLVKTAMHGNDPNWGRIISAAGYAGAPFDPARATLTLQDTIVFHKGQFAQFNPAQVSKSLAQPEVHVLLDCKLGKSTFTIWTCDLSKDYITINADYHT